MSWESQHELSLNSGHLSLVDARKKIRQLKRETRNTNSTMFIFSKKKIHKSTFFCYIVRKFLKLTSTLIPWQGSSKISYRRPWKCAAVVDTQIPNIFFSAIYQIYFEPSQKYFFIDGKQGISYTMYNVFIRLLCK